MTTRIVLFLSLTFLITFPAAAQSGWVAMTINPPSPLEAVKGRPYSYELVSQSGMPTKVFQDAAGRRRTERSVATSSPARADDVAIVEIYDVVAGYRYVLDVVDKVAHRSAIPSFPQRPVTFSTSNIASAPTNAQSGSSGHTTQSSAFSLSLPSGSCDGCTLGDPGPIPSGIAPWPGFTNAAEHRSQPSGKSLGTRVIEGLKCEGRLVQNGSEVWTSKALGIVVLSRTRNARGEERLEYARKISRAKPDAALFQPPVDYKIVDETGPFWLTMILP